LRKALDEGPAERKLVAGKLDPFYHFNTHPDSAKHLLSRLVRYFHFPNPKERTRGFLLEDYY
jgi:hypothetical protein